MHFNPKVKAKRRARFIPRKLILVMKLTALLITIAFLQVSASVYSQQVSLSVQQAPISQVLQSIGKQSGYQFFYDNQTLKDAGTVSITIRNATVEQALDQVFNGLPFTYTIQDKTIIVTKKELSLYDKLKDQIKASLQQVTVTASAHDELGSAMPGVNVRIKGTQNGTTTDSKGNFSITVPDAKTVLVFSFIGYETLELQAKDIPAGSVITLKVAENNLQEVVISKGYYDEKKELSTGDVSVVGAKTIGEQPVSDPIEALNGRVAGLNITQTSGLPGSYDKIQIRGQNSIANGNDPLYVIDGVPFSSISMTSPNGEAGAVGNPNYATGGSYPGNSNGLGISPFNALNPADIESIEVLKDADATAIYGSRGANGVILITTKKGNAGDTRFTLNAQDGIGQVPHFMNMLNTQQYLEMRHEAFNNDGIAFPSIQTNPYDYNYDVDGVWDTTRYTNWQKVLIGGTANYSDIEGTLTGGTANTHFLLGAGYNHQTTVYPGDFGDKRGSVHFSLTHSSANQKFHLVFSSFYVNDNSDLPSTDFTQFITLAPDAPALYLPNGSINWAMYNGSSTFSNPIAANQAQATAVTNNLVSNLSMSYQLMNGLLLQSDFGYVHDEMTENYLLPATVYAPPFNTNPSQRSLQYSNSLNGTWTIEPKVTYNYKIKQGTLNLLAGMTFQQNSNYSSGTTYYGFASDALISDPNAASNIYKGITTAALYRYNSVYGRAAYNWEDKYILNLTVRRDGSSLFGPGYEYGNFGAAGAVWIFSKEKFISDNIPWLNFGKLRLSYGTAGNNQIAPYQYLSTYTPQTNTYQNISGLEPTSLTNPDFHWETVKKAEVGIELGFLQDRIHSEVSYYRDRTNDELVSEPLTTATGFSYVQYNLPAIVQNSGLEATLNTINIRSSSFTWRSSFTFTLPYNKLVAYENFASSPYRDEYVIGKSLYGLYVYNMTGVNSQTGAYTYATANSNGIPSQSELVFSPPITAKFYGGMDNTFSYKGFSLDVFVQFKKQLGYNYLEWTYGQAGGVNLDVPTVFLNRWQQPGDMTSIGKFSTEGAQDPNGLLSNSNAVFSDASFIRIKTVSLSYTIPKTWQQWAHLQNVRIFVQGQNLYTFTHYIGLDPDTQGLVLPELRTITTGINASF